MWIDNVFKKMSLETMTSNETQEWLKSIIPGLNILHWDKTVIFQKGIGLFASGGGSFTIQLNQNSVTTKYKIKKSTVDPVIVKLGQEYSTHLSTGEFISEFNYYIPDVNFYQWDGVPKLNNAINFTLNNHITEESKEVEVNQASDEEVYKQFFDNWQLPNSKCGMIKYPSFRIGNKNLNLLCDGKTTTTNTNDFLVQSTEQNYSGLTDQGVNLQNFGMIDLKNSFFMLYNQMDQNTSYQLNNLESINISQEKERITINNKTFVFKSDIFRPQIVIFRRMFDSIVADENNQNTEDYLIMHTAGSSFSPYYQTDLNKWSVQDTIRKFHINTKVEMNLLSPNTNIILNPKKDTLLTVPLTSRFINIFKSDLVSYHNNNMDFTRLSQGNSETKNFGHNTGWSSVGICPYRYYKRGRPNQWSYGPTDYPSNLPGATYTTIFEINLKHYNTLEIHDSSFSNEIAHKNYSLTYSKSEDQASHTIIYTWNALLAGGLLPPQINVLNTKVDFNIILQPHLSYLDDPITTYWSTYSTWDKCHIHNQKIGWEHQQEDTAYAVGVYFVPKDEVINYNSNIVVQAHPFRDFLIETSKTITSNTLRITGLFRQLFLRYSENSESYSITFTGAGEYKLNDIQTIILDRYGYLYMKKFSFYIPLSTNSSDYTLEYSFITPFKEKLKLKSSDIVISDQRSEVISGGITLYSGHINITNHNPVTVIAHDGDDTITIKSNETNYFYKSERGSTTSASCYLSADGYDNSDTIRNINWWSK